MVYLVSFMIFKINKEYVCEMSKNGTKKEKKNSGFGKSDAGSFKK